MQLIKWITMVDTFFDLLLLSSFFVCDLRIPELFAASVLFDSSVAAQFQAFEILESAANVGTFSACLLSILLNTCLGIDLILMLKYPFAVKQKRTKIYLLASFAVATGIVLCWLTTFPGAHWVPYLPLTVCCIYICTAVVSVFYAAKKLSRPGISKESQRLVLIRHIVSMFGFMLS